ATGARPGPRRRLPRGRPLPHRPLPGAWLPRQAAGAAPAGRQPRPGPAEAPRQPAELTGRTSPGGACPLHDLPSVPRTRCANVTREKGGTAVQVKDVMTEGPTWCTKDTSLTDVARLMVQA